MSDVNVDMLRRGWLSEPMTHDDVSPADPAATIREGRAHLGIELGSTRIKAALVDDAGTVLATGSHAWESSLSDGAWTYPLQDALDGVAACYAQLAAAARERHGEELTELGSLGISAMMHGYLALDADGEQIAPFRTWRNTFTADASALLSETLALNIPLRWSISHLLHAVMGGEEHVARIAAITTLSGWVHEKLTGRRVLGVGDASGMFPIAASGDAFDAVLLERTAAMDALAEVPWSLAGM